MPTGLLALRPLQTADKEAFNHAVHSFKTTDPDFDFAFCFDPDGDFNTYVNRLENWSKGKDLPTGFVPNTFLVGVVDNKIIGRISIRHQLTPFLRKIGGHVGYGVVHEYRGSGYATQLLNRAIPICAGLGINDILVTCDTDNVGSRKVIEKCGGIFEAVSDEPELTIQKRLYWIKAV